MFRPKQKNKLKKYKIRPPIRQKQPEMHENPPPEAANSNRAEYREKYRKIVHKPLTCMDKCCSLPARNAHDTRIILPQPCLDSAHRMTSQRNFETQPTGCWRRRKNLQRTLRRVSETRTSVRRPAGRPLGGVSVATCRERNKTRLAITKFSTLSDSSSLGKVQIPLLGRGAPVRGGVGYNAGEGIDGKRK